MADKTKLSPGSVANLKREYHYTKSRIYAFKDCMKTTKKRSEELFWKGMDFPAQEFRVLALKFQSEITDLEIELGSIEKKAKDANIKL